MKRSIPIIAAIAALAACGAATNWMLARPRMNPRMSYAMNPPQELHYPHWAEPTRGYAGGGETGMTMIAWMKYSTTYAEQIIPPFVMGSCTAEAARPTREGGAPLTNLVTGTLSDAQQIDVSSGSWAMECLPTGYAVPSTLADSQWQYGCYCINVSTDTPMTLSVADTELYIPATNSMVRNVQGSSASRYVIVTPESASANVQFGIAEMPLHQFVGTQSDGESTEGGMQIGANEYGGLDETWRMFAFRARIDEGKMIVQMDGYTPGTHLSKVQCVTQELLRVRSTFEKDAMFRFSCAGCGVETLTIGICLQKMFDGWITDEQVERIRDLDILEMARQGATFPELAPDYRVLVLRRSSTYETQSVEEEQLTNGCSYAYRGTLTTTKRAAEAEVVNGFNYSGPFGPADYTFSCAGASVSNNVVRFHSAGTYTVRATDPVGGFVTNTFVATDPTTTSQTRLEFLDDLRRHGFSQRVADWLYLATNDGAEYDYNGTKYRKWHARRLPAVPSACGRWQGHCAKHAISPHVLATARHYGFWPAYEMTFTDLEGNSAKVNPSGIVSASDWALAHGFTQAQVTAADVGDLMLMTVKAGEAVPEGCCPYLMTAETWRRVVNGPFGTLGWCATQTDLGWGLPVLFKPDISTTGGGYGAKWTWAASFPFASDTAAGWSGADRLMPRESFNGWEVPVPAQFAPTYGGDSGLPLFLEDADGRFILVSNFHTVQSGTCYPLAFDIVRAYCESVGDTIKEWRAD